MENNEMFGGGGMWIFALLILLLIGGGGAFGMNGGAVTSNELQRGFDTNALEQQIRGITYGLSDLGYALDNKIEMAQNYTNSAISDLKNTTQNQFCESMRNVDSVRFDMANYHADTNAVTVAQTQKILDALAQNKIEALQSKVNELELKNAFCGVPKISNYGYGITPQFAMGCGCGYNSGTMIY